MGNNLNLLGFAGSLRKGSYSKALLKAAGELLPEGATLEIFDEKQAQVIDQLEAEKRVSGQIRFALQVPDLTAAMQRLVEHGATVVHPPVLTPWGDRNVRMQDPDGLQVTLFQVLEQS